MPNLADLRSPMPVNAGHSLNNGRVGFWLVTPNRNAGAIWQDLLGRNPGTLTNMTSTGGFRTGTTRPSAYGHIAFDAVDDLVDFGALTYLSSVAAFTVSGWAKLPATNGLSLWQQGASGGTQINVLGFGDGVCYYRIGNQQHQFTWSTYITANVWFHYAFVYDGSLAASSRMKSYINGQQTTPSAAGSPGTTTPNAAASFNFQVPNSGAAQSQDGLSIWTRALSASEVRTEYDLSLIGYPGVLNYPARMAHNFFRVPQQYTQSLTATSTVSASIIKQINKPVSATSTGTASCTKSTGKRLTATSTGSASLTRSIGKVLTVTATGTASIVRSVGKTLSATATGTAAIVKAISKRLTATAVGTAVINAVNLIKRVVRIIKGGGSDGRRKGGSDDGRSKGGGIG